MIVGCCCALHIPSEVSAGMRDDRCGFQIFCEASNICGEDGSFFRTPAPKYLPNQIVTGIEFVSKQMSQFSMRHWTFGDSYSVLRTYYLWYVRSTQQSKMAGVLIVHDVKGGVQ